MKQLVLLGDEAIAQGALDAGISGCYAYPGTPSTEIMEYVQSVPETRERGIHAQWSCNEKTAMEEGLGMSYAGRRALVCMKHVGLNVAADGFVNSAITGTNGGLVVVVADDPSMHSSQNEQDSRFYAQFARIPCLEPSSQQEAYDMMSYAFDLSETHEIPVLLRLTTRLAHSRANVAVSEPRPQRDLALPEDARRFVLLPAIARQRYKVLLDKQEALAESAAACPFTALTQGPDTSLGILAAGLAYNYVMECFPEGCPHPLLKLAQYPFPTAAVQTLLDTCDSLLVVEDGFPFIEDMLHGPLSLSPRIRGRRTGHLPREGELNPGLVAAALGREASAPASPSALMRIRPPRLCSGCPHCDSYQALVEVLKEVGSGHVFSDIGCYTLGALPPYDAISTCVDMGASISMAKGAADAGLQPAVAVIGDSTFTHSGMTPLLDAVWENTNITVFILDNSTTGMTGGQDTPATGRLEAICAGLGIPAEHVRVLNPMPRQHDENVAALREEIFDYAGPSVVIARRECIHTMRRRRQ